MQLLKYAVIERERESSLAPDLWRREDVNRASSGFTIVELLIVIVVIGILAAITIVAYSNIQQRARDSVRAQDLSSIKQALLLYNTDHGGVLATSTYGGNGPGGWNLSSMPSWLSFINSSTYGRMPVDPVNTGIVDPGSNYELTYFYYCYATASPYVTLGYYTETAHTQVTMKINVDKCL